MKKILLFFSFISVFLLAAGPLTEEKNLSQLPHLRWRSTAAAYAKGTMLTPAKGITASFTYPIVYDDNGKPKGTSWPRCNLVLPRNLRDWSKYDFLEFSVYTAFNRSDEEHLPVTIGIGGIKSRSLTAHNIKNLRQNQWVKVTVPFRKMKKNELVRSIQFHLNARLYFPNDKLVLHVGDFKLVRLVEWQLAGFKMTAPAIFADRNTLPVEYELLGHGKSFAVPFRIYNSKGKKVRDVKLLSNRGFEYRTLITGKLAPGKYVLAVFPDDKQRRSETPFQVIAPPAWTK